jgi:hypothetical protein
MPAVGDPEDMARVEETSRNIWRLVGRGREETAPAYLQFGVLALVGCVVGLVVGLVFLAQALTS